MPLLLPIGKMTFPSATLNACTFPQADLAGLSTGHSLMHLDGAAVDIGKPQRPLELPGLNHYWYQHVGNPFDGGPMSVFDDRI